MILLLAPSLISMLLLNIITVFSIGTNPIIELVEILVESNNSISIEELYINITSFFLAAVIFIYLFFMKPKDATFFDFNLMTFFFAILVIPFFIDLYFKYYEINLTYIEFFYPYFSKLLTENFLNDLLMYYPYEEATKMIKIYSKAFSYVLYVKKYIFDFCHKYYIDLVISLLFFIVFIKIVNNKYKNFKNSFFQ